MSIYLHTYDGHEVQAVNDARLYKQLTNNACGMVEGGTVTAPGGLSLHVDAGWGIVNGRLFTIQAENVTPAAPASGTAYGAIYLHFDTTAEEPAQILTATGASIRAIEAQLNFDDITAGYTENNIILATYEISTVAVSTTPENADPVAIVPATAAQAILKNSGVTDLQVVTALPADAATHTTTLYFVKES